MKQTSKCLRIIVHPALLLLLSFSCVALLYRRIVNCQLQATNETWSCEFGSRSFFCYF
jgi:hypothetical protein